MRQAISLPEIMTDYVLGISLAKCRWGTRSDRIPTAWRR